MKIRVRKWKRIGEDVVFLKFNNYQSLFKLHMTYHKDLCELTDLRKRSGFKYILQLLNICLIFK